MKIEIEDKDYIKAITPFRNGCSFKPLIKSNGDIYIDVGCCLYPNLLDDTGAHILYKFIENGKKPYKISISPETKTHILSIIPCKCCGGLIMEERHG